jgi:hypothetical protein
LNPRICSFLSLSKVTPQYLDTQADANVDVRRLGLRWLECAANRGTRLLTFAVNCRC